VLFQTAQAAKRELLVVPQRKQARGAALGGKHAQAVRVVGLTRASSKVMGHSSSVVAAMVVTMVVTVVVVGVEAILAQGLARFQQRRGGQRGFESAGFGQLVVHQSQQSVRGQGEEVPLNVTKKIVVKKYEKNKNGKRIVPGI
jgi:hypothetical protein